MPPIDQEIACRQATFIGEFHVMDCHFNKQIDFSESVFQDIVLFKRILLKGLYLSHAIFHQSLDLTNVKLLDYVVAIETTFYNSTGWWDVVCEGFGGFTRAVFKNNNNIDNMF